MFVGICNQVSSIPNGIMDRGGGCIGNNLREEPISKRNGPLIFPFKNYMTNGSLLCRCLFIADKNYTVIVYVSFGREPGACDARHTFEKIKEENHLTQCIVSE